MLLCQHRRAIPLLCMPSVCSTNIAGISPLFLMPGLFFVSFRHDERDKYRGRYPDDSQA